MAYFESVIIGFCIGVILLNVYTFIRGKIIYRWYQLFLDIAYQLDMQAWKEGRMRYSYLDHFFENLMSYQQALVSFPIFSKWDCFTNKIVRDTFRTYYEANFK